MKVTRDEAERSLQAVQQVRNHMRKSIATGSAPQNMIIWGAIWLIGYLGSHFLGDLHAGRVWIALVVIGGVVGWLMGYRLGPRVRIPGAERLWQFWIFLWIYIFLWTWIAWPLDARQISLLIVTYTMFGYVILGLWTGKFFTRVGLVVTALALLGYWTLPDLFYLWMAFLGGGTLIGSGLYILRAWK